MHMATARRRNTLGATEVKVIEVVCLPLFNAEDGTPSPTTLAPGLYTGFYEEGPDGNEWLVLSDLDRGMRSTSWTERIRLDTRIIINTPGSTP